MGIDDQNSDNTIHTTSEANDIPLLSFKPGIKSSLKLTFTTHILSWTFQENDIPDD